MARWYPDGPDIYRDSGGEARVYEALRRLPDDYVIFHSFRWLGNEGQQRSEGEADFIILHPEKGILSVEVKAGAISYECGRWLQQNRLTGEERPIDPLGQAAESQYRLYWELRHHFRGPCPMVGRAAWFPSILLPPDVHLPLEAVPEILLTQADLDDPEAGLARAYDYWRWQLDWHGQPLDEEQYRALVRLLMPSFRLTETIASSACENEKQCLRLTRQQSAVLHFLGEAPDAAIHGPAGTGKTVLALEKARMLAEEGQVVLFLCYNELLLARLRAEDSDPLISFHNVRTLAEELMPGPPLPIDRVVPAFEAFLTDEFPDDHWPYPNIVIDEGQDLSDGLLARLHGLVRALDGVFYIFYDRNQYIMQPRRPQWIETHMDCRLVLYKNCRNTREIAASIGRLTGLRGEYACNPLRGRPPQALFYRTADELRAAAERFVAAMRAEGLRPEDMAILTVHSRPHSDLRDTAILAGIPLAPEPRPGAVCFTSVRKFKGLEAAAILLIDAETSALAQPLMKRLLYVGSSRAKTHLQIAFRDDLPENRYGETFPAPIRDKASLLSALGMEAMP